VPFRTDFDFDNTPPGALLRVLDVQRRAAAKGRRWGGETEDLRAAKDELKATWARRRELREITEDADWRRLLHPKEAFETVDDLLRLNCELPQNLPADDHCSLWQQPDERLLWVSQPYPGRLNDALPAMLIAGEKYGLSFEIRPEPSWHNPGNCVLVVWHSRALTKEPRSYEHKQAYELTKTDLLESHTRQLPHYARFFGDQVYQLVAEHTDFDARDDGQPSYAPVDRLRRAIPCGIDLEVQSPRTSRNWRRPSARERCAGLASGHPRPIE
jgi:hypothetical protein